MKTTYTEEIVKELAIPHIDIYGKYADGVLCGYRAQVQDGYVMHDTTEKHYEYPEPDCDPIPVIYYYTCAHLPAVTDFNSFPWEAVERSGVDENYIF